MKRIVLAAAALAAVLALPSLVHAQARSVTVTAHLTGSQEIPLVITSGVGKAVCTITDTETTCTVVFYNAETSLVGAHIHAGGPGIAGPVILDSRPLRVSNDHGYTAIMPASELIRRPEQGINSYEDFLQACSSGGCYFNVHTQLNPGGYIRGQLCPTSAAANPFTGIATCTNPQ